MNDESLQRANAFLAAVSERAAVGEVLQETPAEIGRVLGLPDPLSTARAVRALIARRRLEAANGSYRLLGATPPGAGGAGARDRPLPAPGPPPPGGGGARVDRPPPPPAEDHPSGDDERPPDRHRLLRSGPGGRRQAGRPRARSGRTSRRAPHAPGRSA